MKSYIGLIGVGVMGQSLILNMANHGYSVSIYDLNQKKQKEFMQNKAKDNSLIHSCDGLSDFVESLMKPRKVMLLVPAGKPTDEAINELIKHLDKNDSILDCGNSNYKDTQKREKYLKGKGIHYFGVGVSGGEKGALEGPSIMPGGNKEFYESYLSRLLTDISAHTKEGDPCCSYIGTDGAGHFVKMVHNGIEYGDMQIICEAYEIMSSILHFSNKEMAAIFDRWNNGKLKSYLIEITSKILLKKDGITGKDLVDIILDEAGQKGTGKWTSMEALDMGVSAPTITESVYARCLSAKKEERIQASAKYCVNKLQTSINQSELVTDLEQAVYASKIISYAQGFALLKEASNVYHWNLDYGNIALLWREGCIIRAQFLGTIKQAYTENENLENLLVADVFVNDLQASELEFRKVVVAAIENGLYIPSMLNSLQYFDGYRSTHLPANLLQAQRDWFGAHTYHRIDRPIQESFHTHWED